MIYLLTKKKYVIFSTKLLVILLLHACLCNAVVSRNVDILRGEMKTHLSDERRGERIRSGLSVVIAGSTNVGKSSLLNQLCKLLQLITLIPVCNSIL